jgi:hypothetical protein
MEKHTLLHFQVHSVDVDIVVVFNAKIGLVNFSLPFRIDVFQKIALMCFWVDI